MKKGLSLKADRKRDTLFFLPLALTPSLSRPDGIEIPFAPDKKVCAAIPRKERMGGGREKASGCRKEGAYKRNEGVFFYGRMGEKKTVSRKKASFFSLSV